MRKIPGLVGATLLFAGPALAADVGMPMFRTPLYGPAFSWTGFYAGVNGGYGWSGDNVLTDGTSVANTSVFLSPSGGFGGGQIGYNWQVFAPRVVLGVEADLQGAWIKDTGSIGPVTQKAALDSFGTIRGRIGYTFDTSLLYATAGFAYGKVDNEVSWGVKNTDTATGFALGAGYEFKLSPTWSVKAEYQYLNLGKNEPTTPSGTAASAFSSVRTGDDAFHTLRIGVNYHWWR